MHSRQLSIVNPRATALEPRNPRPCILLGGETFQAVTRMKLTCGKARQTDFDAEKKGQNRGRKGIVENHAATTSGVTTLIRTWASVAHGLERITGDSCWSGSHPNPIFDVDDFEQNESRGVFLHVGKGWCSVGRPAVRRRAGWK